jgi:hypothetical protein
MKTVKPRTPKFPKCGSHLFLSRILEICVCQGLDTGTREVLNPEISKCGTHLPFFRSLEVCICSFLGTCTHEILNSEFTKY